MPKSQALRPYIFKLNYTVTLWHKDLSAYVLGSVALFIGLRPQSPLAVALCFTQLLVRACQALDGYNWRDRTTQDKAVEVPIDSVPGVPAAPSSIASTAEYVVASRAI